MPRSINAAKRLEKARVIVLDLELPPRIRGLSCRVLGWKVVLLNQTMDRVERRCVMMHEYQHLWLFGGYVFGFHVSYRHALQESKIEAAVKKATAMALVPPKKLRDLLKKGWRRDEIAEFFDVTREVVEDAIALQLRADSYPKEGG